MIGIIGGSGFYFLEENAEEVNVITPYGDVVVQKTRVLEKDVAFIARHGKEHSIPPHKVNYRANIAAFNKIGVDAILGTYAAGIISKYEPGDVIVPDDFIGLLTPATFFDDFSGGMKHIDFSQPYDENLKRLLFAVAKVNDIPVKKGGIIATTAGPRFETKAEIKALKSLGANLVSMTHSYEAALIGELGIPYLAIAVGTNYACGISKERLTSDEVIAHMEKAKDKTITLVQGMIKRIS